MITVMSISAGKRPPVFTTFRYDVHEAALKLFDWIAFGKQRVSVVADEMHITLQNLQGLHRPRVIHEFHFVGHEVYGADFDILLNGIAAYQVASGCLVEDGHMVIQGPDQQSAIYGLTYAFGYEKQEPWKLGVSFEKFKEAFKRSYKTGTPLIDNLRFMAAGH